MKYKVVGWTESDDFRFEEDAGSFAAHAAIVDDIRKHGYDFSGWHHQEAENGAPVLNNGKICRYSQRGWGGVMADAFDDNKAPYDYARYAFSFGKHGEEVKMPPDERSADKIIKNTARELLSEEEYDFLFEGDYTLQFPHPELGDHEVYTLTAEEADEVSYFETVRQLPNCIMNRLFPNDLTETFELDSYECELKEDRITLKMRPELAYVNKDDTVIYGGKSYTVSRVDQHVDVSDEVRLAAIYSSDEKHEEALEVFKNAGTIMDIFIYNADLGGR